MFLRFRFIVSVSRLVLVTGGKPWGLSGFKITVLSSGSIPSTASKVKLFRKNIYLNTIKAQKSQNLVGC